MGKYSLILVAGFAFTFGIGSLRFNTIGGDLSDNFVKYYKLAEAREAANSMASMTLGTLSDDLDWRSGYTNFTSGSWKGWAVVQDSTMDSTLALNQVRISAGGISSDIADTVVVIGLLPQKPGGINAPLTTYSDVRLNGKLIVDGRDHKLPADKDNPDINMVPGAGSVGVRSKGILNLTGAGTAKIGGVSKIDGLDYTPEKAADAVSDGLVEQNISDPVPSSPDELLDLTPPALINMAKSGKNGGQYVTTPDSLTFPLSGVTYVDLQTDGSWNFPDDPGSGILVVHNSTGTGLMQSVNTQKSTFTGILIADDIQTWHWNVVGAVVALTTTPSDTNGVLGNGGGAILYSKEAIRRAVSNAHGGHGGVVVQSWRE